MKAKEKSIVITSALRTAIGTFNGSLKNMQAHDLGAIVVKENIKRSKLKSNEIDEIIVIGQPSMCVFAFKSNNNKLDIFVLADNLENKGWFIERQQNPNSLHLTITLRHTKIIDEFICDLMSSIRESIGIRPSGKAAIYGSAVAITNPEVIDDILIHYTGLVNDGIDNCGILAIT